MRKTYLFLLDKIHEKIEETKDIKHQQKILDRLFETFLNNFHVMYMEDDRVDEAFIIFETLNARGKTLETADLLKNFIFSKSGKYIDEAQHKWQDMQDTLRNIDLTKYIRSFWNSSHKHTIGNKLYRAINKEVISEDDSINFVYQLDEYAGFYWDMCYPSQVHELKDKQLIDALKGLNILDAKTFYPIMLAMRRNKKKFTENDIGKVAKMIESCVFRNATICGYTANRTEKFFANIAFDISQDRYSTLDEICKEIRDFMEDDETFQNMMLKYTTKKKDVIRYIFGKIYQYNNEETMLNNDYNDLHIEHIMPQKLTDKWAVAAEEHEQYLWKLGNLTMMSGTKNSRVSNKAFSEKKKYYMESQIPMTRALASYKTWGIREINDRQKDIAEIAVKVWAK